MMSVIQNLELKIMELEKDKTQMKTTVTSNFKSQKTSNDEEISALRLENKKLLAQLDHHSRKSSPAPSKSAPEDLLDQNTLLKKKFKKEEELRKNFQDLAKKREEELKRATTNLLVA